MAFEFHLPVTYFRSLSLADYRAHLEVADDARRRREQEQSA